MTEHEKQQLVDEGTHEWCEECDSEGRIYPYGTPSCGENRSYACGYCDGEGIVAKERFSA